MTEVNQAATNTANTADTANTATQSQTGQPGQTSRTARPRAPRQQRPPQQRQDKRQPRPTNAVLERLFELYPALFGAQFLPLKLGVYKELLALHPEEFKPEDLKIAMGLHARSMRYLEAVAAGHQRHGLDGQPVEPVAVQHVHHAMLEVFKRRQGRTPDDLRPHLRVRLMAAIEASGLSCEDYAALVRVQDEATNALLDDAIAELGREAAKREALMQAFIASERTEAEFADMYGMNPATVAAVLARVRLSRSTQPEPAQADITNSPSQASPLEPGHAA